MPDTIMKELLDSLGIKYKYRLFDSIPEERIFAVYYFGREILRGSDSVNLIRETDVTLVLFTPEKDFALERQIETALSSWELAKTEEYDYTENLFAVTYEFTIITKEKIRRT